MIDRICKCILHSLDSYIVVVDEHGVITFTNQTWGQLVEQLGSSRDICWLDKNYFDCCSILQLNSTEYRLACQRGFARLLAGEISEFIIECSNWTLESKIWLEVTASIVVYDQVRYVLLNHRNVIDRKKNQEEILKLTTKDAKTGLANYQGFKAFYENEWQRSKRSGSEVALLVGELPIVDLQTKQCSLVANVFSKHARRACDLACSIKANQFSLVLGQVTNLSCKMIAEQIYQEIAAINLLDSDGLKININIGFSSAVPTLIDDSNMLLKAVDLALSKGRESSQTKITGHSPTIIFKQQDNVKN